MGLFVFTELADVDPKWMLWKVDVASEEYKVEGYVLVDDLLKICVEP